MLKVRANDRIEFLNRDEDEHISLFDLSRGGVCCLHDKKKERGAIVTVSISDIAVPARVSYCSERTNGFRLGLEFWNVPDDRRQALEELVEKFSRGVPLTCSVKDDVSPGKK